MKVAMDANDHCVVAIKNRSGAEIDSCILGPPVGNLPTATVLGYRLADGTLKDEVEIGVLSPGETIHIELVTHSNCPQGRLTIPIRARAKHQSWRESHSTGIRWQPLAIGP